MFSAAYARRTAPSRGWHQSVSRNPTTRAAGCGRPDNGAHREFDLDATRNARWLVSIHGVGCDVGAIRRERRTYRQRQAAEDVRELLDEDTTLVVSHWEFTGVGYLTSGDTALALSAAARTRERRQAARDAA
ncbi:MAG: hypothetical protein ACRDRP_07580 [Pseudonocardiaceae bacterium]